VIGFSTTTTGSTTGSITLSTEGFGGNFKA